MGLRPEHPRVIATAEDFDRLARLARRDPKVAQAVESMHARAREMAAKPVSHHELLDGKRLLFVSHTVVSRVRHFTLSLRLHPDQPDLADRLRREVLAVADFPDWNPRHFLDTGEMAHGMALAYDWAYDCWTDAERRTIRRAIIDKGFDPYLERCDRPGNGFPTMASNWNQVCNGGVLSAALAIAEDEPQLCGRVVREAVEALPHAMATFAPEGGWPEGVGYWGYTMRYTLVALGALESALGHDFGLSDVPGLDRTAWFPVYATGATGRVFNFSDCHEQPMLQSKGLIVGRYWLSRRFGQTRWLDPDAPIDPDPMALVLRPQDIPRPQAPPPRDARFAGIEMVSFRSAWNDPRATWFAAQGGPNPVGHDQADHGGFVFESAGQRWAIDLGPDEYNLPGYFSPEQRYTYYRNRAEGHNVVVVGPDASRGQADEAGGVVTDYQPNIDSPSVTMDLTPLYPMLDRYTRRFELTDRASLRIVDQLAASDAHDLWWFMHTRARATVRDDGRAVHLEQGDEALRVALHQPTDARLRVMPARPLPTSPDPQWQNPNDGTHVRGQRLRSVGDAPKTKPADPAEAIRKLALHIPRARDLTIEVTLQPM